MNFLVRSGIKTTIDALKNLHNSKNANSAREQLETEDNADLFLFQGNYHDWTETTRQATTPCL